MVHKTSYEMSYRPSTARAGTPRQLRWRDINEMHLLFKLLMIVCTLIAKHISSLFSSLVPAFMHTCPHESRGSICVKTKSMKINTFNDVQSRYDSISKDKR